MTTDDSTRQRLLSMQTTEWAVMEAAAAGRPVDDLLEIAVRGIEEVVPNTAASLLLVNEGGESLRFGAGPSLPADYAAAMQHVPVGPCAGSCGTAVYRRKPVIVEDIATDPLWEIPRAVALGHGFRACWSTPVLAKDGSPMASIAVYFRECRRPTLQEQESVERTARLVAMAMERERRERALIRNRDLLRIAGQTAKLGGWSLTVPGMQLQWSDEIAAIHGEAAGFGPGLEAALDYYVPGDRAVVRRAIENCAAQGVRFDLEVQLQTRMGALVWVRAIGEAVRDGAGRVAEIHGALQDITDRKRTEEGLARINRLYAVLTRVDECIARRPQRQPLFETICRVAVAQGQFRLAAVMELNEATGDLAPVAHAGSGEEYLRRLGINIHDPVRNGGTMGLAIRTRRHDVCNNVAADPRMRPCWEEAAAHEFRSAASFPVFAGGRVFGLFVLFAAETDYFQDDEVDLLLAVQNALSSALDAALEERQSEEKLREQAALLDAAYEAIFVKDMTGRIVYWNKGAERTYGWSSAEALGRVDCEIFGISRDKMAEASAQLLERGTWTGEWSKRIRSGQSIPVETRWTLVRDGAGAPKSVLVFDADITERKRLEQQFLRAQRLESLGTLAGGIAHDLNNLLAPITMGVGLLRLEESSANNLEVIANIEQSAARGAQLVKQVLSFARGVEGVRVMVDLAGIVQEVETIITSTLPKNIRIELRTAPTLHRVLGDGTQLQQVLLNLCVNARDAMPQGGVLTVSARNAVAADPAAGVNGAGVEIEVADTGGGIPPEIIDRIFEPFFTTKEQGKGTGLGLSTALGIVRSHRGTLNVTSSPGRGSHFKVYLPAAVEAPGAAAAGAGERPPAERSGRGEWIMVVDDEKPILRVAGKALEAFGYHALLVDSGAAALSTYRANQDRVKAIVSDMMMPGMDGPALIASLRRMNRPVPIIAVSGLSVDEQRERARLAGAEYFLPKPYSAEAMLREVRRALDAASAQPSILAS